MHTTELNAQNFAANVDKDGIVFIDFWAAWCSPCRSFAPIYEQAAERYPDIVWGKVDVDAEQELAGTFSIRSIPTLMIFRDGIPIFSQAGLLPGAVLDELVQKVRELDMDEVRRELAEAEGSVEG
jgi:thioredoxin 1